MQFIFFIIQTSKAQNWIEYTSQKNYFILVSTYIYIYTFTTTLNTMCGYEVLGITLLQQYLYLYNYNLL